MLCTSSDTVLFLLADGLPLVVSDPQSPVARSFSDLGAVVVQEIAKLKLVRKNSIRFDMELRAFVIRLPDYNDEDFVLDPVVVRRNDTSAKSLTEWTGSWWKTVRSRSLCV